MRRVRIQFGRNVRKARESLHLTQEELADLSGLHRTYVGGIERGERNPSLVNVAKLARSLRLRPSDLMRGVDGAHES